MKTYGDVVQELEAMRKRAEVAEQELKLAREKVGNLCLHRDIHKSIQGAFEDAAKLARQQNPPPPL